MVGFISHFYQMVVGKLDVDYKGTEKKKRVSPHV